MKKIVTAMGVAILTLSAVQVASAGQRSSRSLERSQQVQDRQFRDSNAYYGPDRRDDGLGFGYGNRDYDRLEALRAGGATAAPAGR